MIEKLGLSASFAQSGFAEIIVESGIDGDDFLHLCMQSSKEIGSYVFEEINFLHTVKAYRAVLEIMCDDAISPRGEVFWLKHPDYPEIVFEILPAPMELYKVYVVDGGDRQTGRQHFAFRFRPGTDRRHSLCRGNSRTCRSQTPGLVRAAQNGGEMNRRSCVLKRIGILPDLFLCLRSAIVKSF